MVDAHVSGACSERSAGSSPVPGTKEILQVTLNERKSKIFFLLYPKFGHIFKIETRCMSQIIVQKLEKIFLIQNKVVFLQTKNAYLRKKSL